MLPEMYELKNGRWYGIDDQYKPSVTTILNVIAKGIGYEKWLANSHSYQAAMEYADERAGVGSHLHTIFAHLISGAEVYSAGLEEEKIKRIQEFIQFWNQNKPIAIATEYPMWHTEIAWAGTADLLCDIKNTKGETERWLLDWKTGNIWPGYKYQLSAYKYLAEACFEFRIDRLGLVQFKGSHRGSCNIKDKPKYKFIEIKPFTKSFIENIYELWLIENDNPQPIFPQKYPETLKLEVEDGIESKS